MQNIVSEELLPFLNEQQFAKFDLAVFVFYESERDVEDKIASIIDVLIGYKFLSKIPSTNTYKLLHNFIHANQLHFPDHFVYEKLLSLLVPVTIPNLQIEVESVNNETLIPLHSRLGIFNIHNQLDYSELMTNCCKCIYYCDFLTAIHNLQILKCNKYFANSTKKVDKIFFDQAVTHLNMISNLVGNERLRWETTILKAIVV